MLPCKVVARNSNVENTRIEITIPSIFFCPARTAANASQPLPELMFGTKDEIRKLAEISKEVKPDFIKTSTGFGTGGATVDVIKQYIQSQGAKNGKQSNLISHISYN